MKNIYSIIIEIGGKEKIPISGLYRCAKVANEKPETGISGAKRTTLNVIRDCAKTTMKYFPIEIFNILENPIEKIRKNKSLNEEVLKKFSSDIEKNPISRLLYLNILDKSNLKVEDPVEEDDDQHETDIYGGYGYEEEKKLEQSSSNDVFENLKKIFLE